MPAHTSSSWPPYKQYVALLTQTGTGAPTANVLQNTLGGTVTLARSDVGTYTMTLAAAFPSSAKLWFSISNNGSSDLGFISLFWSDANTLTVLTFDTSGNSVDGSLTLTPMEVRVYP